MTALIFSGVFTAEEVLPPLLSLSDECVAMAEGVAVGLLLFRGAARVRETESLCLGISAEGQGAIAMSAHLSPNAIMLVGQNGTLEVFDQRMPQALGANVRLRRLQHRWPPLHTPLMHQRDVTAKVAERLAASSTGGKRPKPPVLSLVSGRLSYERGDGRENLVRWVTQPQRLSDAICHTLASGVQTIVHVGPRPEPIRTTFAHISSAVADRSIGFGTGALRRLARHPQLARLLFSQAAFLRATCVSHVVLEDWLLENQVERQLHPVSC